MTKALFTLRPPRRYPAGRGGPGAAQRRRHRTADQPHSGLRAPRPRRRGGDPPGADADPRGDRRRLPRRSRSACAVARRRSAGRGRAGSHPSRACHRPACARHRQALLVSPFIMQGANTPVTTARALARLNAEATVGRLARKSTLKVRVRIPPSCVPIVSFGDALEDAAHMRGVRTRSAAPILDTWPQNQRLGQIVSQGVGMVPQLPVNGRFHRSLFPEARARRRPAVR